MESAFFREPNAGNVGLRAPARGAPPTDLARFRELHYTKQWHPITRSRVRAAPDFARRRHEPDKFDRSGGRPGGRRQVRHAAGRDGPLGTRQPGGRRRLRIFVLDGGIRPATRERIVRSWPAGRFEIDWVAVDDRALAGLPISGHIQVQAYFRILTSRLLPSDVDKAALSRLRPDCSARPGPALGSRFRRLFGHRRAGLRCAVHRFGPDLGQLSQRRALCAPAPGAQLLRAGAQARGQILQRRRAADRRGRLARNRSAGRAAGLPGAEPPARGLVGPVRAERRAGRPLARNRPALERGHPRFRIPELAAEPVRRTDACAGCARIPGSFISTARPNPGELAASIPGRGNSSAISTAPSGPASGRQRWSACWPLSTARSDGCGGGASGSAGGSGRSSAGRSRLRNSLR